MGQDKFPKQGKTGTKRHARDLAALNRPSFSMRRTGFREATHGYRGTVICGRCHAIWASKHWHLNEQEYQSLNRTESITRVICPACLAVERADYDGVVNLQSDLILFDEAGILALIDRVEAQTRRINPMARIASLHLSGERILITTITTTLAERIAREIQRAYDGTTTISLQDRARFVRVDWHRPARGLP